MKKKSKKLSDSDSDLDSFTQKKKKDRKSGEFRTPDRLLGISQINSTKL